jgi:ribA/ribD-fused uncharacterized protein
MKYSLDWVKERYDLEEALKFIFFWGHTSKHQDTVGPFVFSQWYPVSFIVDEVQYYTAEHWMMGQKALLFGDRLKFMEIIQTEKAPAVKALGRQIMGFNQAKWDGAKFDLIVKGNVEKFNQNEKLKSYLISTNDHVLVEASPNDNIWGIGMSRDTKGIENPHSWQGQNLLGFALMEARDLIRSF